MTASSCILPDTYETREAIYISPPMTIGKHEWCCVVYRHPAYGACTNYHWRRISPPGALDAYGPARWSPQNEWPRYNSDDTYSGLPRRLLVLWERYRPQIEAALASGKGGAS
jgi:hypothetical protein